MKIGVGLGIAVAILIAAGCGGSSGPSGLQVRVVNAVPGLTGANVAIGSTIAMENGSYASFTGYVSCTPGTVPILLTNQSGATLSQFTTQMSNNSFYTVYADGNLASPSILVLNEIHTTPSGGNVNINVVDLSPTLAGVDVYITAPGAALTTPSFVNLQFQGTQSVTMPAAQYVITFMNTGTTTVVASYTSGVLPSGDIPRYLLLDAAPGGATQEIAALAD